MDKPGSIERRRWDDGDDGMEMGLDGCLWLCCVMVLLRCDMRSASQAETLNLLLLIRPRPTTGTITETRVCAVGVAVARREKASHGAVPNGTSNTLGVLVVDVDEVACCGGVICCVGCACCGCFVSVCECSVI